MTVSLAYAGITSSLVLTEGAPSGMLTFVDQVCSLSSRSTRFSEEVGGGEPSSTLSFRLYFFSAFGGTEGTSREGTSVGSVEARLLVGAAALKRRTALDEPGSSDWKA